MKIAVHPIGELARERGLLLADIADRLEVSPSVLSAIALRKMRPRWRVVRGLAELLEVDQADLLELVLTPLLEVPRRRSRLNKRIGPIDYERWASMPESDSHAKGRAILQQLAEDVRGEMQRREAERVALELERNGQHERTAEPAALPAVGRGTLPGQRLGHLSDEVTR